MTDEAGPGSALAILVFDVGTAHRVSNFIRTICGRSHHVVFLVFADATAGHSLPLAESGSSVILLGLEDVAAFLAGHGSGRRIAYVLPNLMSPLGLCANPRDITYTEKSFFFSVLSELEAAASLSMEDLYFSPKRFIASLHQILAMPGEPDGKSSSADADPAAYAASVRTIHGLMRGRSAEATFRLDHDYPVAGMGIGTQILLDGWSQPEDGHTWSNGTRARLALSVPASPDRPLRALFRGYAALPDLKFQVFVRDVRVTTIETAANPSRDVLVDIPLSFGGNAAPEIVVVEFAFEKTVVPAAEGGSGDKRSLALALKSFTLTTVPTFREPPTDLSLLDAIDGTRYQAVPTSALVHAPQPQPRSPHPGFASALQGRMDVAIVFVANGWPGIAESFRVLSETELKAIIFKSADMLVITDRRSGNRQMQFDGGLSELIDTLKAKRITVDLLLDLSDTGLVELADAWDRLMDGNEAFTPTVIIRSRDFEAFHRVNDRRKLARSVVTYDGDYIFLTPVKGSCAFARR